MISKEKLEKRIQVEYENFVFQGYTDAEISYMGTCLQRFVIDRRSGPGNLKLEKEGAVIV